MYPLHTTSPGRYHEEKKLIKKYFSSFLEAHVHTRTCVHTHTPAATEKQQKSKVSYLAGKLTVLIHLPDFFLAQTTNHLSTCRTTEGVLRIGSLILLGSGHMAFIHRIVLHSIFNGWEAVGLPAGATERKVWLVQVLQILNYVEDYLPAAKFLLGKKKRWTGCKCGKVTMKNIQINLKHYLSVLSPQLHGKCPMELLFHVSFIFICPTVFINKCWWGNMSVNR